MHTLETVKQILTMKLGRYVLPSLKKVHPDLLPHGITEKKGQQCKDLNITSPRVSIKLLALFANTLNTWNLAPALSNLHLEMVLWRSVGVIMT